MLKQNKWLINTNELRQSNNAKKWRSGCLMSGRDAKIAIVNGNAAPTVIGHEIGPGDNVSKTLGCCYSHTSSRSSTSSACLEAEDERTALFAMAAALKERKAWARGSGRASQMKKGIAWVTKSNSSPHSKAFCAQVQRLWCTELQSSVKWNEFISGEFKMKTFSQTLCYVICSTKFKQSVPALANRRQQSCSAHWGMAKGNYFTGSWTKSSCSESQTKEPITPFTWKPIGLLPTNMDQDNLHHAKAKQYKGSTVFIIITFKGYTNFWWRPSIRALEHGVERKADSIDLPL